MAVTRWQLHIPLVVLFTLATALPLLCLADRGDLLVLAKLDLKTQQQIEALGNDTSVVPPVIAGEKLGHPAPKNGVTFYKVIYETRGVQNESTFASGLLLVPYPLGPQQRSFPLVTYTHYTEVYRSDVPSFQNADAIHLAIYFGSQGYVVAAPDYIGLGDSPGYHPYFHAETLQGAAIDLLRASQQAIKQLGASLNGQLFITGYSEGGSAAMMLHHSLETTLAHEFTVTASAPMAGPYDLPFTLKTVIQSPSAVDPRISTAEVALLAIAYSNIYGGIYSSIRDIINEPFASQALLAFDGLHNSTEVLGIFNGTPTQVLNSAFIKDIYDNPRNRFVELCGINNGYRWSDWKPVAPIRLYHGHADTEVPYRNSELALDWLKSIGAKTELVDLGLKVPHGTGLLLGFDKAVQWFDSFKK